MSETTPEENGTEQMGAEDERETSEGRLSLILDNVRDIVFLLAVEPGGDYRFQFVNPSFLAATGLGAEQVIGRRVQEVIPEPAHAIVLGRYAEAIRGRHAVEWQEVSAYPAGERVGEVRVIPLFDEQDRCTHLLGTVHDITALRRADERSEQLLSLSTALGGAITTAEVAEVIIQAAFPIFQATMGLVALLSEDGRRLDCERIVGVPPAEADRWRSFPTDARVPLADAVRERRLVVLDSDASHATAYPDAVQERLVAGDGALVAVPLLVGARCVGGIGLICPPERCQDEEQRTFLWTLAGQCALALERARLYDAERRAQGDLRAAHQQTSNILESITDAFFALDKGWCFTYVNDQAETLLRRPREELLGRNVWEEFPDALGTAFDRQYHRAVSEQAAVTFEEYYPLPLDTWFEVRAYPSGDGLSIYFHNVTERHQSTEALRQFQFIADNANDALFLLDAHGHFLYVNAAACRSLGYSTEQVLRMRPLDIDPRHDDAAYQTLFQRAEGERLPPFETVHRRADGTTFPVEASVSRLDIGGQPLLLSSCRDISERKRIEEERVRQEAELAAAYEREVTLNRIGQAIRGTRDPEAIQAAAVRALGQTLGVDRAYFSLLDTERDLSWVGQDFRRPDLPSLAGNYRISDYQVDPAAFHPDGGTLVLPDVQTRDWPAPLAEAIRALRVRAAITVPLFEGPDLVGTLAVAMADEPRAWTDGEVALIEAVAVQTRAALDAARVQEREHRIASDLQDALQPVVPGHVPGLSLGKYTRAALDEARVGGDFYDVFPLDKELYAIVIGDVSGKGLAAAQQLALIRNSLRTTLYLYRAPAQACATLNGIVTTHDLLAGFVTAFVAVYDASTGRVSYCSCGHEPGLVRRASGEVEALETTGPPLGAAEGAPYGEEGVTLSAGDTLLLYTDGISEAGPSRRELLGTEGLMSLLRDLPADMGAQAQAQALVAEVSTYARGVFRDDVAVLLARRQGGA